MEKKTVLLSAATTTLELASAIKIQMYFGNILSAPHNTHWIPCIPDQRNGISGILHQKWMALNKESKPILGAEQDLVIPYSSQTENIPWAMFFKYWMYITAWDETFRAIAGMLRQMKIPSEKLLERKQKKIILAVPVFGTNLGITFRDAAIGLLFAIRSTSTIFPVDEIHIITPYSTEQSMTSCRTLVHLFNMIAVIPDRGRFIVEPTAPRCVLCQAVQCDVVLACGHMFACKRCEKQLTFYRGKRKCLICREQYDHVFEAPDSLRMVVRDYQCCLETKTQRQPDSGITYIPCGHTDVRCIECETDDAPMICELCGIGIRHKIVVSKF
jgi:acetone carboxylase gamma subunit